MISQFDEVVLLIPMPEQGLEPGDVGVVVDIYGKQEAFEVEFMTKSGRTIAVETLYASQLRPMGDRDVWHTRELVEAI